MRGERRPTLVEHLLAQRLMFSCDGMAPSRMGVFETHVTRRRHDFGVRGRWSMILSG